MEKSLTVRSERRKFNDQKKGKLVPLPSCASTVGSSLAIYYLAYLDSSVVYVTHTSDAEELYSSGYFGKGSLSRGPLDYNRYQYSSDKVYDTNKLKVLSKRRYFEHEVWQNVGMLSKKAKIETHLKGFKTIDTTFPYRDIQPTERQICLTAKQETNCTTECEASNNQMIVNGINNVIPETKTKVDLWESTIGDHNFWGGNDDSVYISTPVANNHEEQHLPKVDHTSSKLSICLWERVDNDFSFWDDNNCSEACQSQLPQRQKKQVIRPVSKKSGKSDICSSTTADHTLETKPSEVRRTNLAGGSCLQGLETCDSDLEYDYGDVVVFDDSMTEEDSDTQLHASKEMKRWQPCLKKDSYQVKEQLQLMPEETMFLMYALGCLIVKDAKSEENLKISQLWNIFRISNSLFIPRYIAYHYYRSKGWVLKNGLKYGADFVLYRRGPTHFHSSFSLLIKPVVEPNHGNDPLFPTTASSWKSLTCVDRMIDTVAKEVLYCYVIRPIDLTEEELCSPKCIPRFKVGEMNLSRWVAKEQRDKLET